MYDRSEQTSVQSCSGFYTRTGTNTPMCELAEGHKRSYNYKKTLCSLSGEVVQPSLKSYTKESNCKYYRFAIRSRKPCTDILASIESRQDFFLLSNKFSLWMPHRQSMQHRFLEHHFTTVMSNLDCNMNNCIIIILNNITNKNLNFWGMLKGYPCNVYQVLFVHDRLSALLR